MTKNQVLKLLDNATTNVRAAEACIRVLFEAGTSDVPAIDELHKEVQALRVRLREASDAVKTPRT